MIIVRNLAKNLECFYDFFKRKNSHEIYKKIMIELNPNSKDRERMDYLYSGIRGTPPPDICEIVMNNPSLYGVLRAIDIESKISNEHVKRFAEIISAGNKGE